MRESHVTVFSLGIFVFPLVLLGGVFPSMAQAVDLTINFVGSGTGRVDGSGTGTSPFFIFTSKTIPYDSVQPPSSVTLTPTPTGLGPSQSTFGGWTGCASTSGTQCTVVMDADKTVTVAFNLVPVNLTVNFVGTGTGRVDGSGTGTSPFQIFTSKTIPYDQVQPPSSVTLMPTPTGLGPSQSTFGGWTGCASTPGTQCTVVMDANKTVTVTFNPVLQRTLTVTKIGTGSGTVTSAPAGISCGGDCTEAYADGTAVTLTAAVATGSTFGGWSGGVGTCSGTTNPCAVSMTAARTVTATFTATPAQRTLTVSKIGTGSGVVTSAPAGISCGGDCTEAYADGTAVTLTATPATGSTFGGWSGGVGTCSGTTNPCAVSMTTARTVTATFTPSTGGNQAPLVNAGTPQTVTLPNTATLAGTVTDDGLPATPGRVTSTWSKVSGPGTVTFANASAPNTTATFSQAGAYVLRLTATDGALSRNSDINITVNNPGVRKLSNDLNADGTADLLWRNSLNGVVVGWLMKDAAVASTGMLAGLPSAWQIMGTGDVNADGQADVVLRNTTTGVVAVWVMNGLTITSVGFPGSASLSYVIKGIGDVDGNGTADIVWRDVLSGAVAIWLMNGTTIASSGFPAGVPLEWEIAGLGDVNADNKADVIWRNMTDGLVAVWLMNGLTVTSTGFPGGATLNYVIKEIGDVDGNGTADLVWEDIINHGVAVWLMNGTTVAFAGFPGGVPTGWKISGLGDVNADGQSDVILQNTTNGAVALWLMDGNAILRTVFPSGTSTDWEIQ